MRCYKFNQNVFLFLFFKATLGEIFNQINTAELEEVRKRAIKFLVAKIPGLFTGVESTGTATATATAAANNTSPLNKELEDLIVKHVKQVCGVIICVFILNVLV